MSSLNYIANAFKKTPKNYDELERVLCEYENFGGVFKDLESLGETEVLRPLFFKFIHGKVLSYYDIDEDNAINEFVKWLVERNGLCWSHLIWRAEQLTLLRLGHYDEYIPHFFFDEDDKNRIL